MGCPVSVSVKSMERSLSRLRKSFPRVDGDIAGLYEDISKTSHQTAGPAKAVPGYSMTVWKYRCESTDMGRGKSGGLRVLAFYYKGGDVLFPFLVYIKKDFEKEPGEQPSKKIIGKHLEELFSEVLSRG